MRLVLKTLLSQVVIPRRDLNTGAAAALPSREEGVFGAVLMPMNAMGAFVRWQPQGIPARSTVSGLGLDPCALSTDPFPRGVVVRVLLRKRVATFATFLSSVKRRCVATSQEVLVWGHGFKVLRPNAVADEAQVVKLHSFGNGADQLYVGPAMGRDAGLVEDSAPVGKPSVPIAIQLSAPEPSGFGLVDLPPEIERRGLHATLGRPIAGEPIVVADAKPPCLRWIRALGLRTSGHLGSSCSHSITFPLVCKGRYNG